MLLCYSTSVHVKIEWEKMIYIVKRQVRACQLFLKSLHIKLRLSPVSAREKRSFYFASRVNNTALITACIIGSAACFLLYFISIITVSLNETFHR